MSIQLSVHKYGKVGGGERKELATPRRFTNMSFLDSCPSRIRTTAAAACAISKARNNWSCNSVSLYPSSSISNSPLITVFCTCVMHLVAHNKVMMGQRRLAGGREGACCCCSWIQGAASGLVKCSLQQPPAEGVVAAVYLLLTPACLY